MLEEILVNSAMVEVMMTGLTLLNQCRYIRSLTRYCVTVLCMKTHQSVSSKAFDLTPGVRLLEVCLPSFSNWQEFSGIKSQ